METGTLKELDVKPGDVVEAEDCAENIGSVMVRIGRRYTIRDDGNFKTEEQDLRPVSCMAHTFRLISRASDQPTLWRDMTPEQKGALLLAAHEGKVIEYLSVVSEVWREDKPRWCDSIAYRIKPEPKVEVVTLYGGEGFGYGFYPGGGVNNTHVITFNTLDGVPDCASVKMEAI